MKLAIRRLAAGAALALVANAAAADVLPPGSKGVKNTLAVEGKIPATKMLIIGNTFFGADRSKPGGVVDLAYHPLQGPMKLVLVDAKDGGQVPEKNSVDKREANLAIAAKGLACSEEFSGTRTIVETEPADEIRLVFQVEATESSCKAKLVRTEYYAKDGKAVAGPDGGAPTASPKTESSAAPDEKPAGDPKVPPPAEAPRSGSCACALGDDGSPSIPAAVALVLAAAALARKKR